MDRLLQMEVFVAVNETGSFARAADRMRMSPPAVTRAVASLEDRLGVALLTRSTRRLNLTDAGARYLAHTKRLLDDIEVAEKDAGGGVGVPQGHLSVAGSVTFGRVVVAPLVRAFLAAHPRITASVIGLDRVVNLLEEGVDVAVRIGNLPDSSLIARRVGAVQRVLVASPDYLERRGVPQTPADLKLHGFIGFTGILASRDWHYKIGKTRGNVVLAPRFEVNDATAAIDAALAGEGVTMALSYMVSDLIKSGKLVPVLPDYLADSVPVHLVYPQSRLIAPKLRAFLDFSANRLKQSLLDLSL